MNEISQRAERRGINQLFLWAAIVCVVLGGGALALLWIGQLPGSTERVTAGVERTQEQQGQSRAGTRTEPPPTSSFNSGDPETTGRAETIAGSGQDSLTLNPQQIDSIKSYAASQPRIPNPNFTVAIGVAVPRQVQLQDLPPRLSQGLPSPEADGYFLAENQFVIVEKQTRRVVAIVPVS